MASIFFQLKILQTFLILVVLFSVYLFVKKRASDLVISVGAFVSVPLVWAAKFLSIPVLIHQQDLRPGLANRLMAKAAQCNYSYFPKLLKSLWFQSSFNW